LNSLFSHRKFKPEPAPLKQPWTSS